MDIVVTYSLVFPHCIIFPHTRIPHITVTMATYDTVLANGRCIDPETGITKNIVRPNVYRSTCIELSSLRTLAPKHLWYV